MIEFSAPAVLQRFGAPCRPDAAAPLRMESVQCCICEVEDAEPLAVGEDFEYRTSPDLFLAVRCRQCGLVYLNPRPAISELSRIYPPDYHAFDFSEAQFGFVYKVRRQLEAKRLLSYCRGLREDAHIVDIGCGDGFHLDLLREFGKPGWTLEGIDPSEQAVRTAAKKGLTIHQGTVQELNLPEASYDLALIIATIEHVENPAGFLAAVQSLLCPGGRAVIVTDNTDSLDFQIFKGRAWGGYHFPRHWNLFNPKNLRQLAEKVGLEMDAITTAVSPVNWVYSIRNTLVDWKAPQWIVNQFSLKATFALVVFTLFDMVHQVLGRGALIKGVFRRPQ